MGSRPESMEAVPFVEKYRPQTLDGIVLDPQNRRIFARIVETGHVPHLCIHGPPGTGKTTTAHQLIRALGYITKGSVIQLNASDDRGVAVIRNTVHQYVESSTLFTTGLKFVILDEVDSMTADAQQALRCLLQECPNTVRVFIICNYMSLIDQSLKDEFVCIRFNCMPEADTTEFLMRIVEGEQLQGVDKVQIERIQALYGSDIRSMVNHMQSHQYTGMGVSLGVELVEEVERAVLSGEGADKVQQLAAISNVTPMRLITMCVNHQIAVRLSKTDHEFYAWVERLLHAPYTRRSLDMFVEKMSQFLRA